MTRTTSDNESPQELYAIAVDPAGAQKIREVADELQISHHAAASLLIDIANSKTATTRHASVSKAATFLGLTLLSKAKTDPVSASIVRSLIKCATIRYRKTLAEIRLAREPKTDAGDDAEPDGPIIDESAREACPVRVDAQALEKVRALADLLDSNQVTAASLLIEVASRTTAVTTGTR